MPHWTTSRSCSFEITTWDSSVLQLHEEYFLSNPSQRSRNSHQDTEEWEVRGSWWHIGRTSFKLEEKPQVIPWRLSLTHLCLASHIWYISKQCRPRSDAAERGVWSVSILFALITGIPIKHGNNKNWPDTPKTGNGLVQSVQVERVHSAEMG